MPTQNPLLAPVGDLIDYARITPEHLAPAIESLLAQARNAVECAADPQRPATWEAVVAPLDLACEALWRTWSVVGHLKSVVNTPALREAYNAMLPKVSEFGTWVGLHEGLYQQYLRLRALPDFATWPAVRQRIIELALRDFRLSGVELQGAARQRYAEIAERQSQVAQKFSENVLDATDSWFLLITDEARLEGIPADICTAARQAAAEAGQAGWKLTLHMPCYLPVMPCATPQPVSGIQYAGFRARRARAG